jgi:hypothetical protein
MRPYASSLELTEEINVEVIGKFVNEVPSGLCAVTYQHFDKEMGQLNPSHPLSFTGHCIFTPTEDGRSLISESSATFYRGDSLFNTISHV